MKTSENLPSYQTVCNSINRGNKNQNIIIGVALTALSLTASLVTYGYFTKSPLLFKAIALINPTIAIATVAAISLTIIAIAAYKIYSNKIKQKKELKKNINEELLKELHDLEIELEKIEIPNKEDNSSENLNILVNTSTSIRSNKESLKEDSDDYWRESIKYLSMYNNILKFIKVDNKHNLIKKTNKLINKICKIRKYSQKSVYSYGSNIEIKLMFYWDRLEELYKNSKVLLEKANIEEKKAKELNNLDNEISNCNKEINKLRYKIRNLEKSKKKSLSNYKKIIEPLIKQPLFSDPSKQKEITSLISRINNPL